MNPTLLQVLVLVGVVLGAIGTVLHFTAPRTKTLLDDRAAAGIDKLLELLKKLGAGPGLALLVVGCVVPVLLLLPACGASASTRHQTLAVAVATLNGTRDTFMVYDQVHEQHLATTASSPAAFATELDAYHAKRDVFVKALGAAYDAVKLAVKLDDDPSISSVLAAATEAAAELATLQGSK